MKPKRTEIIQALKYNQEIKSLLTVINVVYDVEFEAMIKEITPEDVADLAQMKNELSKFRIIY